MVHTSSHISAHLSSTSYSSVHSSSFSPSLSNSSSSSSSFSLLTQSFSISLSWDKNPHFPSSPSPSPLLNFQTFGQFPQSGPPANSSDGLCPLLQHNYNPGAHLGISFKLQRFLLYFFLSCCEWSHIFSNFGDVVMDRRHSARLIPS